MKPVRKQRIIAAPSASKIKCIGGKLSIEGLDTIEKSKITSIVQQKFRAEVVQVTKIGHSSYTPEPATVYGVQIGDPMRDGNNGGRESWKVYRYVTPDDITSLGATAALQREAIHGKLVTLINADNSNFVTAATLGTGTGFTITDDAGYYPAKSQGNSANRLGATRILVLQDVGQAGWKDSTDRVITTAAVYAWGVGDHLINSFPVYDPMHGNIVSGYYEGPKTIAGAKATSGQKYDSFQISSLILAPAHQVTGQLAYQIQEQTVFVDNGTGTSTAQLTGYLAFEREMLKVITDVYASDARTVRDFFDTPILFQGAAGAVPTTTGANKILSSYGGLVYTQIGTETITVPTPDAAGLLLDQDATDTEGAEYTTATTLQNIKKFIVGDQAFSIFCRIKAADLTDSNFLIGFRKEGAHQADYNDYTDLAAVGHIADDIYTVGILNNAATVSTDTAVNGTDATWYDLELRVAVDGTVTALYNNTSYPIYSAGTTALVLDSGDVMVPFFLHTNRGGQDPDEIINMFFAVGTDAWRI